jgi:hypothetical protein
MFSSSQPEAHFGGDGNFHGVDHAADERGGFGQFGHHGRAAADVADLADGAAHVDVHRRDAAGFKHLRGVAHFFGYGPEQLDGQRRIGGPGFNELERLRIFSRSERALTRSVVQRPTPPISRTTRRKGRLV